MKYDPDKRRIPTATRLLRESNRQYLAEVEWLMWGERYLNALGALAEEIGISTGIEFAVTPNYESSTATLAHYHDYHESPEPVRKALDALEQHCNHRLRFVKVEDRWESRAHMPGSHVASCFYVRLLGDATLLLADRTLNEQEEA